MSLSPEAASNKRGAQELECSETSSAKRSRVEGEPQVVVGQLTTQSDGTASVATKKIVRKKKRPAPPQVDPSTFKSEPPPQTGTIFNIWYNKWSGGDREDKYLSKTKAPSRCNIAKHSGYTKADSVPGSFFCLFFARGICPRGRDCEYLHRLPSTFDLYSGNVDCFGREKHSDYRDDMGGVGSFMRQNRTLYIGRIHPTDDVEEIVARHFAEWGKIERTRVLPTRGVAFVTYATESLAQFAKEAMAHQSLDNDEVLNVRWATADPNPAAQKREVRRIEQQAAEAIRRALPAAFIQEIEGKGKTSDQRRLPGSGREANEVGFYDHNGSNGLLENDPAHPPSQLPEAAKFPLDTQNEVYHNNIRLSAKTEENVDKFGILSSTTLSALQGYGHGGVTHTNSNAPGAQLVGYDSSDDED